MVQSAVPKGNPKFRVAICGGGIAGTSLAYMIHHYNSHPSTDTNAQIDVQIYETADHFGEIGAGLTVWPRSLAIMDAIDLGGPGGYERYATLPPEDAKHLAYEFRKSDGPVGSIYFTRKLEGGLTSFHRAKLLALFSSSLPPDSVHFDKRLISYTYVKPRHDGTGEEIQEDGSIKLTFADGTTAHADIVIGCDGVNSIVRKQLLETCLSHLDSSDSEIRTRLESYKDSWWSRTISYRHLIDMEKLREVDPSHLSITRPQIYCGNSHHIVTYPIDHGKFLNFVTCNRMPPTTLESYQTLYPNSPTKSELELYFKDWEPAVQVLLKCIDTPTRWPILYLTPSDVWVDKYAGGRVGLLGDAAHAMAPHNASGAGMAIEDSFILSTLLTNPLCTANTLPTTLQVYQDLRIPPIHRTMNSSDRCGYIYEFIGPNGDNLEKIGPEIEHITSWLGDFDVGRARDETVKALEAALQVPA